MVDFSLNVTILIYAVRLWHIGLNSLIGYLVQQQHPLKLAQPVS